MTSNKKPIILAFISLIAYLAMITINGLANALPLNGQNTGEVSAKYETLFAPAGITFSIWGVIYLLLLGFVIFQIRAAFSSNKAGLVKTRVLVLFILSCIFNGLWIFTWHYDKLGISVILMLFLFAFLLKIFLDIEAMSSKKTAVQIFVKIPFGIYLGWVSVATVANIAAWLVSLGWTGAFFSPEIWTVIMISIATVLGLLMLFTRNNFAYALVIIWALLGILIKNNHRALPIPSIHISTLAGIVITVAIMGLILGRKVLKPKKN